MGGVTIIDWLENMNLYVSDIYESYKDTITGSMENAGTEYLLLLVVQCRCACAVDEEKWDLSMVV